MTTRGRGRPPKDPGDLQRRINMSLSPATIAALDAAAERTGLTRSGVVEALAAWAAKIRTRR